MIGSLGNFNFSVSSDTFHSFDDLSFNNSASFAEHKIISDKSILEFTGLNPSTASLSIYLDASLGVNPADEISALYEAMNNHETLPFTLGGSVMGDGLWVIERINEKYSRIDNKGNILSATITLSLKEYKEL